MVDKPVRSLIFVAPALQPCDNAGQPAAPV